MREFVKNGHEVFWISPYEKRLGKETELTEYERCSFLKVRTGNLQKTNFIEKGISTLRVGRQYLAAIQKYWGHITFDLIVYATPPITLTPAIKKIKKKTSAKTYLLLKDIFPQNAVDLGVFSQKSPFFFYFRHREKQLYKLSDHIGCMSQANVDFLLRHNPQINPDIVHINPNSMEITERMPSVDSAAVRDAHGIPRDTMVFMYGGNLGRPQDIPFIIQCLKASQNRKDCFFAICGAGTDAPLLEAYIEQEQPENVRFFSHFPREEYHTLLSACDMGLIFLDHRFSIPNFPSRLLSYLTLSKPVLCCTDTSSDVGPIAKENGFGDWCESDDPEAFRDAVDHLLTADLQAMGHNARSFLEKNYSVTRSYQTIINTITGDEEHQ